MSFGILNLLVNKQDLKLTAKSFNLKKLVKSNTIELIPLFEACTFQVKLLRQFIALCFENHEL